jgi:heme-degrading monooxygenase HmoA
MNRITVQPAYIDRFEYLFSTRAKEVDKENGFLEAKILRPKEEGKPYIVMTFWKTEEDFKAWVDSGAYQKGHHRAFDDMHKAREEGKEMPMRSDMETYEVFAE